MTRAPRRSWVVVLVLLLGLLTACVTVPTSGPVTKAGGEAPGCLECVDVDVSPPSAGAEPKQIVDGYLRAMSNYQPNYSVARQFLTSTSAQSWVPEEGTSIYTGTTSSSSSDTVLLEGRLVASLDSHRTYTARDEALRRGFTLVQENGEWRISDPPKGLLVAQYSFERFYRAFNVYFVGNQKTLVPDPIYLPPRVNEATVLVQTLLDGASTWLKPAVTSAVPTTTTLQVSVTVKNGVAEVTLSDSVLPLSNDQRALMAAQIVYTLDQVEGVTKVLLLVGQQPFSVPGADPNDFTISREAVSPDVQPVPYNAAEAYYGVTAKGVVLIDPSSGTPAAVPGPLGTRDDVERLAASVTNTTLAAVTDDSTVLREATGGKLTTVLSGGVSRLLRPQFDRYDQLWAVGQQGGQQKMWVLGGPDPIVVGGDVATAGGIKAFKISPDGVRMALIRTIDGKSELGIARISRTDGGFAVSGWRTLSGPASGDDQVTDLVDLAWSDATNLVVLAATTQSQKVGPYRVSQDARSASSVGVPSGDPAQVAVSLKAPQTTVLVGAGDSKGQTWRDDGSQRWSPFVEGLTTFAFPD